MHIEVNRYLSNSDATLSKIKVVDRGEVIYSCFGLEDEYREVKVRGETRIPAGEYWVGVRKEGGFHARYSEDRRFKDIHRGMLHVLNVPGFEYILIHVGNYERNTDGCLLVGEQANEGRMEIYRSASAYRAFYERVINAAERGELKIRYVDNDGIGR